MAESHDDPNAAPSHLEVREYFSGAVVAFCYLLTAIALIAGVISGLTIIND